MPWHHNSTPPKRTRRASPPAVKREIHPIATDCDYIFGTWKAQAGKARARRGQNQLLRHNVDKIRTETPIIRSPPDRALWPKATYFPDPPFIPIRQSPDLSCLPTQTCVSVSPPLCFLCSGYLGDKHIYTICSTCKTNYTAPSHCLGEEDEYDEFLPASPSPQDENSDSPVLLVDKRITEWKKTCLTNSADNRVAYALSSPSSACSDDESDGCATPALSCSSSVYSQDESDLYEYHESLIGTETSRVKSCITDSADSCTTPELSSSSSVYSQDGYDEEKPEIDTRGYYELPWVAEYFDEHQHSIYKELEENVEDDCSIEINILYK
ncbi:hypothetical protein LI328DRAFT_167355 [Trichoderma asperelloides]|nr:hypothetical protein LI328DRAFT_167355 [Trichoderma asperelloides]